MSAFFDFAELFGKVPAFFIVLLGPAEAVLELQPLFVGQIAFASPVTE